MRAVCVIGLGLIGGSVLRAAAAAGRTTWAATASEQDAEAARMEGFDVRPTVESALHRAAELDALVVIATPLPAVREVLREVIRCAPRTLLTDVVSVREPVHRLVRELAPDARFAGGHPMVGTSSSGWAAGRSDLFEGANWVVTIEDDTGTEAWQEAAALALACGAAVVPTSDAEHDSAVARVSHLPHLLAAVLASVGADGGPLALSLAAGSFRDGTRVMGSDPELVRAMTEGNRAALLDALDDTLGRLGAARGSLASTGGLASTIRSGHQARDELEGSRARNRTRGKIALHSDAGLRDLVGLGARGARVVALSAQVATVEHLAEEAAEDEPSP